MSRGTFILGLVLSTVLHLWLLMLPAGSHPDAAMLQKVAAVIETELARQDPRSVERPRLEAKDPVESVEPSEPFEEAPPAPRHSRAGKEGTPWAGWAAPRR